MCRFASKKSDRWFCKETKLKMNFLILNCALIFIFHFSFFTQKLCFCCCALSIVNCLNALSKAI